MFAAATADEPHVSIIFFYFIIVLIAPAAGRNGLTVGAALNKLLACVYTITHVMYRLLPLVTPPRLVVACLLSYYTIAPFTYQAIYHALVALCQQAERDGQSEAIATNLTAMAGLKVPIVTLIMGEGGSGGALGVGMGNRVGMLSRAYFGVVSTAGYITCLPGENGQPFLFIFLFLPSHNKWNVRARPLTFLRVLWPVLPLLCCRERLYVV